MQATDIQKEEIRLSVNLLYVEGTSEKLWHKLLCKPKNWVVTEDKKMLFMKLTIVIVKQSKIMLR